MPSKSSAREDARSVIARLYERGEEAVGVFVEELLGNKRVREELGKTLGRAADAKKRVDKNMQAVLSLLNLPSRGDLHRLQTKIEALQGSMVNLSIKLDRLLAAQQEHVPRQARPERRPPRARAAGNRKAAHPES
jgi:polyhydroxyalkanoate synthesis regulator phasin